MPAVGRGVEVGALRPVARARTGMVTLDPDGQETAPRQRPCRVHRYSSARLADTPGAAGKPYASMMRQARQKPGGQSMPGPTPDGLAARRAAVDATRSARRLRGKVGQRSVEPPDGFQPRRIEARRSWRRQPAPRPVARVTVLNACRQFALSCIHGPACCGHYKSTAGSSACRASVRHGRADQDISVSTSALAVLKIRTRACLVFRDKQSWPVSLERRRHKET